MLLYLIVPPSSCPVSSDISHGEKNWMKKLQEKGSMAVITQNRKQLHYLKYVTKIEHHVTLELLQ